MQAMFTCQLVVWWVMQVEGRGMMVKYIILCLALCCGGFSALAGECDQFDQDLIQVEDARWCNGVAGDTRQCQGAVAASSTEPAALHYKPLYLWTRISGKESAISKLERCGKLPVYHKWYVIKYYGAGKEKAQLIDEIPLCAGGEKHEGRCRSVAQVADLLRLELRERGFFDWTTWSYKKRVYRGSWQVRLLYNDNTAVMCGDTPCIYRARVQP